MPRIITATNTYACKHCETVYGNINDARDCEKSHDIVYVPLQRGDLKRLVLFLNTGEVQVLTDSLLDTINTYAGIKLE